MTKAALAALILEGAKLDAELRPLKAKADRLDEIKKLLREHAAGVDMTLDGERDSSAIIKHTKEQIARSVPEDKVDEVKELAGRKTGALFTLHPCKDFTLAALQKLEKSDANKLIKLLTVPGTARITLSLAK